MAFPVINPILQFFDNSGEVLGGGLLYTYEPGTTTPKTTYTNENLSTPNTNPIVLSSAGRCTIFTAEASEYKYILKTSAGVTLRTEDEVKAPVGTQAGIGALLYPRTSGEIAAVVTPTNYWHPPGHVYRYGTNTTPGTTDMTAAINTAADVCREGNYVLCLPPEVCFVSSSLDFSSIRVVGSKDTAISIQASAAQFNVITSAGNSTFENFTVDGGWDSSTAGQSGDTFSLVGSPFAYNIHFYNVNVTHNKRRGIYWEGAGYSHMDHVDCSLSGLHGIEIFGTGPSQSTTVHISGQSRFSDCPNGYGVKLTECISIGFDGCIIENTHGIQLNGNDNRAIYFNNVYQEGTIGGLFLDGSGSAGIGLRVSSCYGASTSAVANVTDWQDVSFDSNSSLILPPIPLENRIKQVDGGQLSTSTTGGVSVTAVSVSLSPGTWLVWGAVQTLSNGATTLLQSGCEITGDVTSTGLNNATGTDFRPGADQQNYNPGTVMDHRLKSFEIIQLTTTTTMYLRSYFNYSGAGALTYRGNIYAVLLS